MADSTSLTRISDGMAWQVRRLQGSKWPVKTPGHMRNYLTASNSRKIMP